MTPVTQSLTTLAKTLLATLAVAIITLSSVTSQAAPLGDTTNSSDLAAVQKNLEGYIEIHPTDAEAHYQLAMIRIRRGDPQRGIEAIEEARRLGHPDPAILTAWVARAHAELGNIQEAEKLIDSVMDEALKRPKLMQFLGGVAFEAGMFDWAENIGAKLTEKNAADFTFAEPYMLQFHSIWMRDGWAQALPIVSVAGQKDGLYSSCMYNFIADYQLGVPDRVAASASLGKALDRCASCGSIDVRKGYIAMKNADYAAAVDAFDSVADQACPDDSINTVAALMKIDAMRRLGEPAVSVVDKLSTLRAAAGGSFYWNIISALSLQAAGDSVSAGRAYLKAVQLYPVNFKEKPGPYTFLTGRDYAELTDIAYNVEQSLKTFEMPCNQQAENAPEIGSYVTATKAAGLKNLFRYVGSAQERNKCRFVIYAEEEDVVQSLLDMLDIPLRVKFTEDYLFLQSIYPLRDEKEIFWYLPIFEIFPRIMENAPKQ